MKRIFSLFLLLFLSASSFAARIPLAVYGLTPQQGVAPGLADMVSDMVRMKLRACGRFDLREKAEMDKILKEQGFQQTGCTETECAVKMGKVLNVKKMVVGGLGKIGTAFRLSLRVVDVETARIDFDDAESQTVKEEEMETKLVPPLVSRLCPKIKSGDEIPTPVPGIPEIPTGSLTVNSAPSGATVFLDGETKGLTPQGLTDIQAGEHKLVLTLDGYKDYVKDVTVAQGAKEVVSAVLAVQMGSLRISTTPSGAKVFVDGAYKGVTTEAGLLVSTLQAGEHTVKASRVSYEPYESSAFVEPDVTKDVKVDLSPRPGSVVITSTPSSASVYLNGASKGTTPCSVGALAPGTYSVSLKKEEYEEHTGSVEVRAGRSEAYSSVLRRVELSSAAANVATATKTIPAGYKLTITLESAVSSKDANVGDRVQAKTDEPLIWEDVVLVPEGSAISGKVTEVVRASKDNSEETPARINFHFNNLNTVGGNQAIYASPLGGEKHAGSARVASLIIASGVAGAVLGKVSSKPSPFSVVSMKKGDEVSLPAGTKLTIVLKTPVEVPFSSSTSSISDLIPKFNEFVAYDTPPAPLVTPHPEYPAASKGTGVEGTVIVQILLNLWGDVMQTRVARTSGNAILDSAAVEGAKKYKFTPAMQRGKPVHVWVSMPIVFRLEK